MKIIKITDNNRKITVILTVILFAVVTTITVANDELFRAMQNEMNRSLRELSLEGLQKPYFIEYVITVKKRNNVEAILGQISSFTLDSTSAKLDVVVRVGDYKFDQTNFFDPGLNFFGSSDGEEPFSNRTIPIELDYNTIRRELWLATDAAYKEAAELFAKKEAALKNQIRKDTLWDFSPQRPVQLVDTVKLPTFDFDYSREIVVEASKIFLDFKNINTSKAIIYFEPETIYYLNSEGTKFIKNELVTGFEVAAFTQAEDGMPLYNFYTALGFLPSDLPSKDSILKATREIANTLNKQITATVLEESYSGPILMFDQAAAEIFSQAFLPNLIAQRENVQAEGFRFSMSGAPRAFQTKIGGRVLPEFFTVENLPNLTEFNRTKLFGHYKIDSDGVLPQDILLVENGYLKTLLSDRRPIRRVTQSTGSNLGGNPMFSNVKITAARKFQANERQLKNEMMKLCKQRDLPFGIIVKKVANPNIVITMLFGMSGGGIDYPRISDGKLQPIEVYKIFADGREELVRGGQLSGITVGSFRDIIRVGNSHYVLNILQSPPPSIGRRGSWGSYRLVSIIAPNLLFEDAELQVPESNFRRPPYLPNPISLR